MMMRNGGFLLLLLCLNFHVYAQSVYQTDRLQIFQISPRTFVHISFLETENWGKVSCNGLVFINNGDAIIFDTPANDSASVELLHWLKSTKKVQINALVVHHFHEDCLAGLSVFHQASVPSYSNSRTKDILQMRNELEMPQRIFQKKQIFPVGGEKIISTYFGSGHTKDNIVSYIPSEHILFGGCLIKEAGAVKGNLEDAAVTEWPKTVKKVKTAFQDVKIVVPGHGKWGGSELLDYTITLFEKK